MSVSARKGDELVTALRNQPGSTIALVAVVALTWASAANAAFIDILSNHGLSDPAPYTVINSTDGSGTVDMGYQAIVEKGI